PTLRMLPFLLCLSLLGCGRRDTTDPSHMICVRRLQMPSYPSIAQAAHLSMEVTAAINLTDGNVRSVAFEGATLPKPQDQNLFLPTIERTIRGSAFEPTCGNKTVRLSYAFRMDAATNDVAGSWYGYPNRVEVWAVTPVVQF